MTGFIRNRFALAALVLALPLSALADAGAPTINSVTNNSSDIPAGFPNSGISQGALFKIVGSDLADDGDSNLHDSSAPGGLPTTLNRTQVTVTVGGTTVTAALYYATAMQIDGVLPSNTPIGSGTLTVTHNGVASAAYTILVVAAAPGITTYNGAAIAQDAARPTDPYGGLITFTRSAAPGSTITIWGSGFGATSDSDTAYSTGTPHAVNVSYTIYIGGVQVTKVFFAGRSVYPGVSVFVLTIPQDVPTGCHVPIVAVASVDGVSTVSNTATLPISAGGGVCFDPQYSYTGDQLSTWAEQAAFRIGSVSVTLSTSPQGSLATFTRTLAQASLFRMTGAAYAALGVSIGGCVVTQTGPGGIGAPSGLDAGTISVTPPGSPPVNLLPLSPSIGGFYSVTLPPISSTGGAFVFRWLGGSAENGVGPFTATVNFPVAILTWSNQNAAAAVSRGRGLLVSWDGGAPGSNVTISGTSFVTGAGSSSYTCNAPVEAKQFVVPSYVLLALPSGSGTTSVQNSTSSPFSSSDLDFASATGGVSISVNTTYN